MLKQYKLRFYNFRLIIFLLAISLIGVTLVGTAASDLRSKQFAGVILGLIVMLILSLLDYSWIMNFQCAWPRPPHELLVSFLHHV